MENNIKTKYQDMIAKIKAGKDTFDTYADRDYGFEGTYFYSHDTLAKLVNDDFQDWANKFVDIVRHDQEDNETIYEFFEEAESGDEVVISEFKLTELVKKCYLAGITDAIKLVAVAGVEDDVRTMAEALVKNMDTDKVLTDFKSMAESFFYRRLMDENIGKL